VNRSEHEVAGEQIAIAHVAGTEYFDVWNGVRLEPRIENDQARCSLKLDAHGFGAILAVADGTQLPDLAGFLEQMNQLARTPLRAFSSEWRSLPQQLVEIERTRPASEVPAGMVAIPATDFDFAVQGVEIEGQTWEGLDVQYPWETSARRAHRGRVRIGAFHIDRYPVTNAQYKAFLDSSHYRPRDDHNFLRHWERGVIPRGWENKPVAWVSIEDARAYAQWAGKRLPHEWEWQYAAQGSDGRRFPWGNEWSAGAVPEPSTAREAPPPDDVDAHPVGASPFGVMDLVGNVWQWTDEYLDAHTRAAILRGGNNYQPQTSHWYFPQAYRLDQHGKYLLMAPCKDRSGGIGFRCVVDAA
jgi:formylglycine-generating enzyme required for sulfatase activity